MVRERLEWCFITLYLVVWYWLCSFKYQFIIFFRGHMIWEWVIKWCLLLTTCRNNTTVPCMYYWWNTSKISEHIKWWIIAGYLVIHEICCLQSDIKCIRLCTVCTILSGRRFLLLKWIMKHEQMQWEGTINNCGFYILYKIRYQQYNAYFLFLYILCSIAHRIVLGSTPNHRRSYYCVMFETWTNYKSAVINYLINFDWF